MEECNTSNVRINGRAGRLMIKMAKSLDKGQVLDSREFLKEYTTDPDVEEAMDKSVDRYMRIPQQPEEMQESQMDAVINEWKKILISIAIEDTQGNTQGAGSPGVESRQRNTQGAESPGMVSMMRSSLEKSKAKDKKVEGWIRQIIDHFR